jgi:transposase InsO family protein
MLEDVARERGYPDVLVVDNGPELRGRDLDRWAHDHGVRLFFIDPGKPMQNGSIESFNGRFREECLDQGWFTACPRRAASSRPGAARLQRAAAAHEPADGHASGVRRRPTVRQAATAPACIRRQLV